MKKIIIGALSLLAMVACSQDEVVDVNRNNDVIEFGVVANSLTRAETVYSNTNMPDSFTVWATFEGKTFINGDVIKKQGNTWVNTTTTRYWPAGCSDTNPVTFYAYVDDQGSFDTAWFDIGVVQFSNFTVNSDVTKQKDFLYAVVPASSGPVQLEFKHALYQLAYKAKCTNENMRVVIDGVTICNVDDTNNLMIGYRDGEEWGNWNYPCVGDADFSVEFDPVTLDSENVGEAQTLTSPNSKNALLLVPFSNQNKGTWNPATEALKDTKHAYFLVKCAIANVSGGDEIMLWGEKKDGKYVTKEIAIPIPGDHLVRYASGKQFIYTFVFGEGNGGYDPATGEPVLATVDFDEITVKDFESATEYDMNY